MKKLIPIFAVTVLLIISLISITKLASQQSRSEGFSDFYFAPGKIVIRFTKDVSPVIPWKEAEIIRTGLGQVDDLSQRFKVHTMRRLFPAPKYPTPDLTRYFVIKFDDSMDLNKVVTAFSEIPSFIEKAEKVGIHKFQGDPNDYYYSNQWHLNQANDCDIDASEAWDIQTGSDSVILAIPDSGVKYDHLDLDDNIWINWDEYYGTPGVDDNVPPNGYIDDIYGWNWDDNDEDPMDYHGHGTHCAGIAAAETNNDRGVAGIAGGWYPGQKGCRIMSLRIGFVDFGMDNAAASFQYATDMGATAINCSWKSWYSEYFKDAIDYALQHGVLIMAAAGNENGIYCDDPFNHYLNMVPDVMVVAATDQNDKRAIFTGGKASNYGPCIDVSAPGKNIYSTCIVSPGYCYKSGTSMAAPMVVGLAGLLKSERPDWDRVKIWDAIVLTADPIDVEEEMGSGRINAYKALRQTILPAVPSNLYATPTAYNQIDLSWQDNSDNELEFKIERKTDTSEFSEIGTAEKDIASYQDRTCSMGITYYYRVSASNLSGNSSYSNTTSATIPTGSPTAPTMLTARNGSIPGKDYKVKLTWQDNSNNEQGFKIERMECGYGNWQEWDLAGANETVYWDVDIPCDHEYCYRIRAYNVYGNSSYSNEAGTGVPCFDFWFEAKIIPDKKIINSGDSVTYIYQLENKGKVDLIDVELIDDKFGEISTKFNLKKGKTKTFTKTVVLTETTMNFAEATAVYYHKSKIKSIKANAKAIVEVRK